jgi:acyl-coenzyme A synthetase/AMP-(fatty) acid ligase/acyl carrier protein
MVAHGGLVNYLNFAARTYFRFLRRSTVSSPLSFDATITSLFVPLVGGFVVHLLQDDGKIESLKRALWAEGAPSLFKLTPAHLNALGSLLPAGQAVDSKHVLIIGGEALTADVARSWLVAAPYARLLNEYGPTETVVGCSVHEIVSVDDAAVNVPIGRPIWNTRIYVLDGDLNPLPIGVSGELYIGGAGLARGYLGRAGLTTERFVPSPYGDGERLYRTGDLVRYLADGNLEFLGRVDHQVKVRGYRIELGEIEAALVEHPAVGQAVVVAREDGPGDKRLAAYVVAADEAAVDAEGLRAHLQRSLPEYMVPSAFVELEVLPLTPNGKIDRRALPAPGDDAVIREAYVAPRTPTEEILAGIWCEVLKLDRVGVHDDFFELGGHSLQAVLVIARVRQAFQIELPLRVLFDAPTVSEISAQLAQRQAAAAQMARDIEDQVAAMPFDQVREMLQRLKERTHHERETNTAK